MSFYEIGNLMGISRTRVEQIFIRAIKKLRVEFQKPEHADIRDDFGAWVKNLSPDAPVRDRPQCGKKPGPKPKGNKNVRPVRALRPSVRRRQSLDDLPTQPTRVCGR